VRRQAGSERGEVTCSGDATADRAHEGNILVATKVLSWGSTWCTQTLDELAFQYY
jgi:hypothetical protein